LKNKIIKIYHLFFYKLVLAANKCSKSHYRYNDLENSVFGAGGWLIILFAFLFFILIINIENITERKIISELSVFFPLVIVSGLSIYLFIYYSLLYKNRWQTYLDEFKSYSKKKNILINIIVLLVVLLIIISFGVSLYLW